MLESSEKEDEFRMRVDSESASSGKQECHNTGVLDNGPVLPLMGDGVPPSLERRRSFSQRTVGELTVDGLRHSCLTLTSTALGGGLLAVSYVMATVGLGLGTLMLVVGATMAYLSTVALMQISTTTGQYSYAGLFSHCAGPRAGPILDAMLFIYGTGSCVGYFVFLGDFIPALVKIAAPDAAEWASSRWLAIAGSTVVVLPLALQKELAALRHLTPISICALIYVAIVVLARCFYFYDEHAKAADHAEYGELKVFDFNLNLFGTFAICVFAFNCHINVVPVAGRLIRPTKDRIGKVSRWVNGLQLAFYMMIGTTGYLTFLKKTPQDILKGFPDNDPYMAVGRVLLSFTMMITIPINMHPSVRSFLQIRDYFYPDNPILASSPRSSPMPSPQASPNMSARPLRADSGQAMVQQASMGAAMSLSGANERALPRIVVTIICIVAEVLTAIAVPGVADVIGLLGATVATAMMMLIPAYCIGKALPHTLANRCQQALLVVFSCVSVASVPIKILQIAGVLQRNDASTR